MVPDQGTLASTGVQQECPDTAICLDISLGGVPVRLDFEPVSLQFTEIPTLGTPTFGAKNNKTLGQTLEDRRYRSLRHEVEARYSAHLGKGLGTFAAELRTNGDPFYRRFLNRYGDSNFCRFAVTDPAVLRSRGLYLYARGADVLYIGRCKDSFQKRINQGYGHIHPKNCFLDGQSTNCHINSLMAAEGGGVTFHVYRIEDKEKIVAWERLLLSRYRPQWNVRLEEG